MSDFEEYKKEYGISLDPDQDKACRETKGKTLLLAVPGSGKTTVMISRLGYMTRGLHINPSSILAITYSVAGAKEMKNRYAKLFGVCDVEFRTIHGLCAALISRYERLRGRKAFALLDNEGQSSSILRKIVAQSGSYPSENELKDIQSSITYAKNSMFTLEQIEKEIIIDGRSFIDIYKAYEEYKLKNRLMDYDDQLIYGYKILKSCPDVNSVYTDRFKYICVDEAQDTSKIQHKIIELLVKNCGNVFMVGDEDQSIYGFRAAYPQALLDFKKTYPDADIMSLSKNYRSCGNIVEKCQQFISKSKERVLRDKTMHTDNPKGEMPIRVKLPDVRLLPDYIRRVCADKSQGTTALLFRINDSMLPVIDLLSKKEIPFRLRGSDGLFFTSSIVNDVKDILDFAIDPCNSELFSRLYYKLSLGISKSELGHALTYNMSEDMLPFPDYLASSMYISENKRKRAKKLSEDLFKIKTSDMYEAIRTIFFSSGYGKYYSNRTSDTTKRNVLLALSYRYRSRGEFFGRLKSLEGAVKRGSVSESGIILSTIHSSKGMEFDRVVMCDCKNGLLPSFSMPSGTAALTDEEKKAYEEDRRVFYVGATRAKSVLEFISWEKEFDIEADGFDFIDEFFGTAKKVKLEDVYKPVCIAVSDEEIKAQMNDYFEGISVRHSQFGDGVVINRDGDVVIIRFARYSIPKKLSLYTCLQKKLIWQI